MSKQTKPAVRYRARVSILSGLELDADPAFVETVGPGSTLVASFPNASGRAVAVKHARLVARLLNRHAKGWGRCRSNG